MAWTNVAKPSAQTWNRQNPSGKETYDQSNLTYDDSNVFYDGINPAMWTDVAKPTSGYDISWAEMGMAWSAASGSWGTDTPWINVNKPT